MRSTFVLIVFGVILQQHAAETLNIGCLHTGQKFDLADTCTDNDQVVEELHCGEITNPCLASKKSLAATDCDDCTILDNSGTSVYVQVVGGVASGTGTIPDMDYFLSKRGFEVLKGSATTDPCYAGVAGSGWATIASVTETSTACPTAPTTLTVRCIDDGVTLDPEGTCSGPDADDTACGTTAMAPCLATKNRADEDDCNTCHTLTNPAGSSVTIHIKVVGGIISHSGTVPVPPADYFLTEKGYETLNAGTAPSDCWDGATASGTDKIDAVTTEVEACQFSVGCLDTGDSFDPPTAVCTDPPNVEELFCGTADNPCIASKKGGDADDCETCTKMVNTGHASDPELHVKILGSTPDTTLFPQDYFLSKRALILLNGGTDISDACCDGTSTPGVAKVDTVTLSSENCPTTPTGFTVRCLASDQKHDQTNVCTDDPSVGNDVCGATAADPCMVTKNRAATADCDGCGVPKKGTTEIHVKIVGGIIKHGGVPPVPDAEYMLSAEGLKALNAGTAPDGTCWSAAANTGTAHVDEVTFTEEECGSEADTTEEPEADTTEEPKPVDVTVSCIKDYEKDGDPANTCTLDLVAETCGNTTHPCQVTAKAAALTDCSTCMTLKEEGKEAINAQVAAGIAAGVAGDHDYYLSADGYQALTGAAATQCWDGTTR